MNRLPIAIVISLLFLNLASPALADESRLESRLQAICAKYEGQPSFDSDGHTNVATCEWVRKTAASAPALFNSFRKVLASASDLEGLKHSPVLPRDLDCEDVVVTPEGRELTCWSNLGTRVPSKFMADKQGRILGMSMRLDYWEAHRIASDKAIARGAITKYYEPFIGVVVEANAAAWESQAGPGDKFAFDGKVIDLYVANRQQ